MKIHRPRGTRDFTPEEMGRRKRIRNRIYKVLNSYNYREVLTPTLEHTSLFELKSGRDIKQHMYVFEDKGGRSLCLRPEVTASVCRMYVQELQDAKMPLKLFYHCPLFRYERPQKGRYREFWQTGVELLGSNEPQADAEILSVAYGSLSTLDLDFSLEIAHLGILRSLLEELGLDEKDQNEVIYLLDEEDSESLSKYVDDPVLWDLIKLGGGKEILDEARDLLSDYPSTVNDVDELEEVLDWLEILEPNVDYKLDFGIARGLEYYSGVVFEMRVPGLGAENQVCGGGRYDNLIELFEGPATPAVGFAFGFDRIMNALEKQGISFEEESCDLVIAPVNDAARKEAHVLAQELRENFKVDADLMQRKLSKILSYADAINASYAILLGPREIENNEVTLRDMETGNQETVKRVNLVEKLEKRI